MHFGGETLSLAWKELVHSNDSMPNQFAQTEEPAWMGSKMSQTQTNKNKFNYYDSFSRHPRKNLVKRGKDIDLIIGLCDVHKLHQQ